MITVHITHLVSGTARFGSGCEDAKLGLEKAMDREEGKTEGGKTPMRVRAGGQYPWRLLLSPAQQSRSSASNMEGARWPLHVGGLISAWHGLFGGHPDVLDKRFVPPWAAVEILKNKFLWLVLTVDIWESFHEGRERGTRFWNNSERISGLLPGLPRLIAMILIFTHFRTYGFSVLFCAGEGLELP